MAEVKLSEYQLYYLDFIRNETVEFETRQKRKVAALLAALALPDGVKFSIASRPDGTYLITE